MLRGKKDLSRALSQKETGSFGQVVQLNELGGPSRTSSLKAMEWECWGCSGVRRACLGLQVRGGQGYEAEVGSEKGPGNKDPT